MPEESKQSWWQTLPGTLTAAGALLTAVTGLIIALRHEEPKPVPAPAPATTVAPQQGPQDQPPAVPNSTSVKPQVPETPNIAGTWRDNWGNRSLVTQDGATYHFQAEGRSCTGRYFRSEGSGSISGNAVHSDYQSTLPSQGSCSGTLSANGRELSSTCTDSACGTFVTNSVRE